MSIIAACLSHLLLIPAYTYNRFELLDYVTKHAHQQAKGIALTCLQDNAKEVRSAVLDLVQAARSVFSNPFDFLCKQTLDNTRNTVGMTPPPSPLSLLFLLLFARWCWACYLVGKCK
jgi:hypothetical protein